MLRNLSATSTTSIMEDLNSMWRNGRISDTLKTIKVVAIPKPGRDQSTATGSNGLPQGDVLSPTLFNLYTVGLHTSNTGKYVVLVQYANDCGIIVKAQNIDALTRNVQNAVDKFTLETQNLNFTINPEKTKIILFRLIRLPTIHSIWRTMFLF